MPELPEVETSCRGIAPHIDQKTVAQVVVRNRALRWPIPDNFEKALSGQKLQRVHRRGKYLLLEFVTGTALLHLGMSGNVRIVTRNTPVEKHDHLDIDFGDSAVLRLNDPRRFGAALWTVEPIDQHPLIAHLGPEPLTEQFDSQCLYKASRKRKMPIKSLIMDSQVVVGVGNIYANEALFMSGIRPRRAAGRLTRIEAERLTENIKKVLSDAIKRGGTTLKDFVGGDGKPGYFAQELLVYGRGGETCKRCGELLKEIRMNNRATVYCPSCQQ